jgi:hypothetical protein
MKKICLIFLIASICVSCEKEKDVPLGTLLASVDGKEKNFNSDPIAEWTSDPKGHDLWIHGTGLLNEISITINSQTLISAKTYSYASISFYRILLLFQLEYTTSGATVKITEIDATHVKGTFSGTLYDSEGTKLVLSEGVFNLSIK